MGVQREAPFHPLVCSRRKGLNGTLHGGTRTGTFVLLIPCWVGGICPPHCPGARKEVGQSCSAMPRPRASSGRSLTVLWALLVLFMQFSSNAKPVPRPQVIARDGDKAFDMPLEMQRRLNEEKGKKKKKNASNKTMVFGNETHLLRNLSATIGNGTMKYWDKTTIDPDTEEGMRLLRQLSAEASSSLDCEKDDDCSAGFACMMSGEKCGQQTGCKCSKIIRKVELPPDFIVAGFEPLMQLAPFAVTLEADPALNVRYTMVSYALL